MVRGDAAPAAALAGTPILETTGDDGAAAAAAAPTPATGAGARARWRPRTAVALLGGGLPDGDGSKSYDAKKNTDVSAMGQPPSVSEQMVTRAYTWFGPLQDMQAVANETGVCLKLAKDFVGYYLPGAA